MAANEAKKNEAGNVPRDSLLAMLAFVSSFRPCFLGRSASEGKTAEIDSGYFGGSVKPGNFKEHRRDRRLAVNQSGKRQSVIIVRERHGVKTTGAFPMVNRFASLRIMP